MVLNSLSGELLHASWLCVAKHGQMFEIEKRDLLGKGRLRLDPFKDNQSYFGVDIDQILRERPQEIQLYVTYGML